jgi:hypothetical protein
MVLQHCRSLGTLHCRAGTTAPVAPTCTAAAHSLHAALYTLRYMTGASLINRDWIAGRTALRLSRSTATQEQRCWHRTCFTATLHQRLLTSAQPKGTDRKSSASQRTWQ